MKFHVVRKNKASGAHSPVFVIEEETGQGVGWINRYLDREYVRRLADKSLNGYAYSLLHFVRWWESVHHTGDISQADLTASTLLDYVRFQSSRQPPPSASTINDRVACPIARSGMSSRTLPVRSRTASIRSTCIADPWASAGPGSIAADCA